MRAFVIKRLLSIMLIILLSLTITACMIQDADIHIFSDISECEAISEMIDENSILEVYDSPTSDANFIDLEYVSFYGCKCSGSLDFELYAYEFASSDIAREYFEAVTDRSCDKQVSFFIVAGTTNYKRTVINDNMIYTVSTTRTQAETVTTLLQEVFSIKLIER